MSSTATQTEAEGFFNPEYPPYLTIDDALKAAPFLTRDTLKGLRYRGAGPEFVKASHKTVGYPNAAFFKWLNDATVHTSRTAARSRRRKAR